ncbi:MAG: TrkA family potassium uptake protein [Candidatus Omnitrophica bacterium]|nr:TrkA family potassium uptake protein [Candidatus Omnitrophota bacterium]MBU0880581.1 TrkA family potassium uptake protein [Candidatus Omnitrophota bacterium]MBU0895222.1 TrkA family potassium uptake protein [Candidatus Omnitrophota bacterium]MBU1037651.1 TrkA family potassium uptake protein [Candidatus Omnitrophota bacterium]MBU1808482.1 TrkA family potassium uptake protein [Candidatus Omnitrophota bacterium]
MNVMIIGCGRVGSQLALLLAQEGHNVTIIDKNPEAFKNLGGTFNGIAATGTGFDEKLLDELKINKQDAFISVTSGDNTNLMASQIAKKMFKVPRVIARVYDPKRADIYRKLGLDVISGTTLVAAMIRDKIIENRFTSYLVETGELGVIEIVVNGALKDKRVSEINIPDEFLVTVIERKKRVIIPQPDARLEIDDKVMGVVRTSSLKKVKEKFKL